jgi:hypothetical protein
MSFFFDSGVRVSAGTFKLANGMVVSFRRDLSMGALR